MHSYVAMLRGINVGGRNRVAMADLESLVEELGFGNVRTYVQSGNIVFHGTGGTAEVASALGDGLRSTLGLDVPVVVRTTEQLDEVIASNPFAGDGMDPASQPTLFHVTFLAGTPDPDQAGKLAAAAGRYAPDACRLVGSDVYLHIPGGYGNTKLSNTFFERNLSMVATTRNWRSVLTLATMAGG